MKLDIALVVQKNVNRVAKVPSTIKTKILISCGK
jgi:hypothetical protein